MNQTVNSVSPLNRRFQRRNANVPLAKDGGKHIPSLRKRKPAPVEAQVASVDTPQAAPIETQPVIKVPTTVVNVPEIKVPAAVVNVPEIKVPATVVNVPEIKIPPVVFNYDDKHLATLTEILKEVVETNRVKIEEITKAAKSSNQSADDATSHLKQILELTKDIQRPLATDGSEGDISLDGSSALRFLSNIETKASVLGELQIVKDSLIDSGELLKFKTSTQDLIVALIAAVNQLFNDVNKLHRDQIKSR